MFALMRGSDARPLPTRDLDHVVDLVEATRWDDLRDGRILVTGGTGFFGRWMLESALRASDRLGLRLRLAVLSRDSSRFKTVAPNITSHSAVSLVQGDVHSFEVPGGSYSHVVHLATESGSTLSPESSYATALLGTERVLEFADARRARKLLFSSSGAVYGPQPADCIRVPEGAPAEMRADEPRSGYAQGKRAAEELLTGSATSVEPKIARCFAFVGPLLPLDQNFAIGNFIRDALERDSINVSGDGTARRSYLYAADLAVWLWTILISGAPRRPYNVGSETEITIGELARLVARVVRPGLPIRTSQAPSTGAVSTRYIPSTARAQSELNLHSRVALEDAIDRTAQWHRA